MANIIGNISSNWLISAFNLCQKLHKWSRLRNKSILEVWDCVGFEIYHIQSHILIKQNHYLSYKQRLDDTETNNFERR